MIGLFQSKASLEAEILTLRHQLNVLRRKSPKRLSFSSIDRLIFAGLYEIAPRVVDALAIVKPHTVVRWHRAGFRLFWRWKSRSRGGRPKLPLEIRQLIRAMSLANPLWDAPRIHGELLSWSRLEPRPGVYDFQWLQRAIDILHASGLHVVLGTPTAAPPKWLVDKIPDMVAFDAEGRPRKFGSRRHYCFSHEGYARECDRIVAEIAKAFGAHPGVVAWQTDNEDGCHDTVESYSGAALRAFRRWSQPSPHFQADCVG